MKIKLALIGLLLSSCVVVKHDCPIPEPIFMPGASVQHSLMSVDEIEAINGWEVVDVCDAHRNPCHLEYAVLMSNPAQNKCFIKPNCENNN